MEKKIVKTIMTVSLIAAGLFLGACGVNDRSGVEIVSAPIAKVYLNNKMVGMTPYKNNNLKPGINKIKLDDNSGNIWEREIKLENNISTVINWDFSNNGSGYILSMEKSGEKSSLLVNSIPSNAAVSVEGELKGYTPMKVNNLESGDKNVVIKYSGYKAVDLIVKILDGYQLIIDSKLKTESGSEKNIVTPSPTINKNSLLIKETETGWLRVRQEANNNSPEIGRVKPKEKYEILSENKDWYQIQFEASASGWISAKYVEKISE